MNTQLVNEIRRRTVATINRNKTLSGEEQLRLDTDLVEMEKVIETFPDTLREHSDTSEETGYKVIHNITHFHPQAVQKVEMFLKENGFTVIRSDEFDNGTEPNRTELWVKW